MKMKFIKRVSVVLCALMVLSGCSSLNNTAKGSLIGAGGGAALGVLIGHFAGNKAVGAAVGTAVGAGAGALIGRKMDKAAAAAADNMYAATYLLKAGAVAEKLGDDAKALSFYKKIREAYPQSMEGYDVDKYIGRIEAK